MPLSTASGWRRYTELSSPLRSIRRNPGNAIRVPDVGENLSFHELQFVQLIDRRGSIVNLEPTLLLKRLRIQNANLRRAVTQEKFAAIGRKAPAFSGVRDFPQQAEVFDVIDETHA